MEWYPLEASLVLHLGPLTVIAIAFVVLLTLLFVLPAPYGRYQSASYGAIIPARWAWILQETPSVAAFIWFLLGDSAHHNLANSVIISVFVSHYIYRSWIYPFLLRSKNGFPLVTFAFALTWCLYNGYIMGRYFGQYGPIFPPEYLLSSRFLLGLFLWALGLGINIHSESILRNLRKPGEHGYKIPTGGVFRWVSGAHYLGEIVEWFGFAVLSGGMPSWSFAIFTACNIGPRAIEHHKWYLKNFGDKYPRQRKALIPFIF